VKNPFFNIATELKAQKLELKRSYLMLFINFAYQYMIIKTLSVKNIDFILIPAPNI
jgi:hypothetical protein